ncbi:MAG: globin [Anaerolinea sp.]|nr:globin [Anaerolinea sp.]
MQPEQVTLFERVGGRDAVGRIVEAFYRHVEADPVQRAIYPDDLEPGKEKLKLFFEQWMGGEPRYTGLYGHPRLRRRHFPFVIDELAAGRWLRYMRQAMQEEGVREQDLRQVFEALGPLAHHMVNAGQDVPRGAHEQGMRLS